MNRDLFWKLLEAEHHKANAFCRQLTANKDDGDDLYQDALVRAYSSFGKLRKIESFRPWLYRVIVNRYKSNCRRLKWFGSSIQSEPESRHGSMDPANMLSARIWLRRMFKALSVEERAYITLFEIGGWSVKELAEMSGKSSGTIKSKLSRARAKMRRELEKYLPREHKELKLFEANYALPRSKTSLK